MNAPAVAASIHPAQVAGSFYPADAAALATLLQQSLKGAIHNPVNAPKLVIAPHAGVVFSGAIAATAFAPWQQAKGITRVVIIGPAHRHPFRGIVTTSTAGWQTPLGTIGVAWPLVSKALHLPDVRIDDAPFKGEHAIEMHLPFLQSMLPGVEIAPFLVGDTSDESVRALIETVWGGPETGIAISSDLSHYLDHNAATAHDRATRQMIEQLAGEGLTGKHACGHKAVRGALLEAKRRDLRVTGIDLRTSAQTRGGAERTVGYGAFAFEYAATARLPDTDRATLLDAVASALRYASAHGGALPKIEVTGAVPQTLAAIRATFVTLTMNGQLRGCIGSLAPHRSLVVDVIINAIKAGFGDPRFAPLRPEEVETLDLSVSILSHPRPMQFADEADLLAQLHPDVDGLMLSDGARSGLFLPSVWESLHTPQDFLKGLKRKAGLPVDHWSDTLRIRRFGVEYMKGSLAGRPEPAMLKLI